MKQKLFCVTLAACVLLTACSAGTTQEMSSRFTPESAVSVDTQPASSNSEAEESSVADESVAPLPAKPSPEEYIQQVVQETIERITEPDMSEFEKTKAAFDYLIEIGDYQWPILLDIWRIRSTDDSDPSYVEMRACNFLLTGVGACEDYAAALVMLLEGMGIEARYLPGVTWGRNGGLIYHAWTQAKIDGVWYHMDCELEDGISSGTVRYKYFMKSDATMRASHYWGQNFIELGGLQPDQVEEINREYLGESCPQDYTTPSATEIAVTPRKDADAIRAGLTPELQEYEELNGPLEYRELDFLPPVFGRYGGYSTSGIPEESDRILRGCTKNNLVPPPLDDE